MPSHKIKKMIYKALFDIYGYPIYASKIAPV
jgi:hypothetical protein